MTFDDHIAYTKSIASSDEISLLVGSPQYNTAQSREWISDYTYEAIYNQMVAEKGTAKAAQPMQRPQGVEHLITRTVSANTPTVTLQSPGGGITLTGNSVIVSWSAFDADGDPLTFSLDYSKDGGATWTPLSGQIPSTTIAIDLTQLPGSPQGKFRVWASDGVNTATDETAGTFVVPNKAPQILSVDPISGTTYVVSQTISFEAEAYDPEDGQLPDGNLQWSSDIDGVLGTGALLQLDTLSIGTHTITLTVTDSDNHVTTAATMVIVTAEPSITDWFIYMPLLMKGG